MPQHQLRKGVFITGCRLCHQIAIADLHMCSPPLQAAPTAISTRQLSLLSRGPRYVRSTGKSRLLSLMPPSCRRLDILVEMKGVGGGILALQGNQSPEMRAVGGFDLFIPFLTQEVDIDAACRKRLGQCGTVP